MKKSIIHLTIYSKVMNAVYLNQVAHMVTLDLLVEKVELRVVWRSVSVMNGELCVTRCGMTLMPVLSAGN